jgi:hypothetical protein
MMREGGRHQQRGGYTGKAESCLGHRPLHDVGKRKTPRTQVLKNPTSSHLCSTRGWVGYLSFWGGRARSYSVG